MKSSTFPYPGQLRAIYNIGRYSEVIQIHRYQPKFDIDYNNKIIVSEVDKQPQDTKGLHHET